MYIYKGGNSYIIIYCCHSIQNARMETCVSIQFKPASGLLELDAEIIAASKKGNYKVAFTGKTKRHG